VCLAVLLFLPGGPARAAEPTAAESEFFENDVRPILVGKCLKCHGDAAPKAGLKLTTRERVLKGGKTGPAVALDKAEESLLLRAVRYDGKPRMPPDGKLADRQIEVLARWVKLGVPWPKAEVLQAPAEGAGEGGFTITEKQRKFWAFQPVKAVAVPGVRDRTWAKSSIDPFILSTLEAKGLGPAKPADKRTLLRRATFDLIGLPPTPAEIDAFLADDSPDAFARVVDRLLASPHYGERWGRHWLDVVRYADTAGETADYPVTQAWRYRNYVIDGFNADKPYDEFLREQIAGDVLANQGPKDRYAERATATGYLALSRRFGFDSENYQHLTIQDTIDSLGQTILGLSLGCARCHHHKFDPVSMQDYYALYGIFASSRYAFPGSEQKQTVRSMLPLLPPSESQRQWREHEAHMAALADKLTKRKQPVPAAVLRSLHDIDGDFELQAPAAGGSNGVLVAPWLYTGKIAVTSAAQSPFKNLYPTGKVGVSVPADAGEYRIEQSLYPRRTGKNCNRLYVNLDFRVAAPSADAKGRHRFTLGAIGATPAVEVLISSETISSQPNDTAKSLVTLKPGEWHNLQLTVDLTKRTVCGKVGVPGSTTELPSKAISPDSPGAIDNVVFDSVGPPKAKGPAIEFDNFGVQEMPIAPVSTSAPIVAPVVSEPDLVALTEKLNALTKFDGDFELQTRNEPPKSPWNPGPNSVVKLSTDAQSPFQNIFPAGELGIHMPNRAEYDGFGLTLTNVKPDKEGRLFVSFDFRCASRKAGGDGSWRFYLGHGPGHSAALELYFNGGEFFRRSADEKDSVCPLAIDKWHQVQLTLDLKAKTYTGVLAARTGKTDFTGKLASGWDGTIDYLFIDSYGHIGGVRPSLDADNFAIGDNAFPAIDAPSVQVAEGVRDTRRAEVAKIRGQIAALQANAENARQQFVKLLAQGPFAMTYGMTEGTPHNARVQLRGEPDRPGDVVPRGFIKVLGGGPLPAETEGSGRLELARWLTRHDNPLTPRVMVNRIWQYHFGRGLVKTPNDFGVRGLAPTDPELLDHLATQFIRSGWSVKATHRLIMLSATYQQSSVPQAAPVVGPEIDTADLYASFPRRRLSAEEIRDSILAVCGELDVTPAQEHPFPSPINWGYTQHNPFSAVYDHNKRSVYLMTQRLKRHPFLALFDGADPNATTAQRQTTTVPTQALFFLNDPFVYAKAEKWAGRLLPSCSDEKGRIELAWRRAFGRSPTEIETAEASEFLTAYRAELTALKMENIESHAFAAYLRTLMGSNEFLYVD
jgi:hypothetical protein